MELKSLKQLIETFVYSLKAYESELLAHKLALMHLTNNNPEQVAQLVSEARNEPKLQEMAGTKYDAPLAEMLQLIDEDHHGKALEEFLRLANSSNRKVN